MRSPRSMASMLDPFPTVDAASTLGALLGPVATLALVAILVALGVIVVGLVLERRETSRRKRWMQPARSWSPVRRAA